MSERKQTTKRPKITGKAASVAVLRVDDLGKGSSPSRKPQSLVQFFARSPLAKARINLERTPK